MVLEGQAERIARRAEQVVGPPPAPREDAVTKTIERYTAGIPSTGYLGVAVGAMGVSLLLQLAGRGTWGNFIAQWVPTWLIIGVYNKLVKLEGYDRHDRGEGRSPGRRAVGISNRPLEEEQRRQALLRPREGSDLAVE